MVNARRIFPKSDHVTVRDFLVDISKDSDSEDTSQTESVGADVFCMYVTKDQDVDEKLFQRRVIINSKDLVSSAIGRKTEQRIHLVAGADHNVLELRMIRSKNGFLWRG